MIYDIKNGETVPDDCATLEHIYSRLNPLRYRLLKKGVQRLTLLCLKCNRENNEKEVSSVPVEQWRLRSGQTSEGITIR